MCFIVYDVKAKLIVVIDCEKGIGQYCNLFRACDYVIMFPYFCYMRTVLVTKVLNNIQECLNNKTNMHTLIT